MIDMIRVLIAEDEEIERLSLSSILKEQYKDAITIKCAKNGMEAVEWYQQEPFDIVLMDINMPKLDGLSAIEQMKKCDYYSVYLILTSYDTFSYAKEAIRLGVEDFLLKPAKPSEIIKVISHAITKVKVANNNEMSISALAHKFAEIKPLLENECLYAILTRSSEFEIQAKLKRLNMVVKAVLCFIICAPADRQEDMMKLKQDMCDIGYGCLYTFIKDQYVFYLMHNEKIVEQDLEVAEYVLAQHHMKQYPIGIGNVQQEIKRFALSYDQAVRSIRTYEATEPLQFSINEVLSAPIMIDTEHYVNQLVNAFQRNDDSFMSQQIHALTADLLRMSANEIETSIQNITMRLIEHLQQYIQGEIERSALPDFSIEEKEKYQTLEISLHHYFQSLFHPIYSERYQESSALAKKAMAYIHQNYRKPLSLNDLAKYLHVTPFYVSKLIKNSFGTNFTDVVAQARIEEAKRLLKEHHRVKEIAFDVGFQSQSYFAKMFKKLVGMTPSEYQDLFL